MASTSLRVTKKNTIRVVGVTWPIFNVAGSRPIYATVRIFRSEY